MAYWSRDEDLGINDLQMTSFSERTETHHLQTNSKRTNDDDSEEGVPHENYSAWIRSKIKMRQCIHFVPRTEDPTICHCGHEKNNHMKSNTYEPNPDKKCKAHSKYVFLRDTRSGNTNAFGEIEFIGRGGDIKPKFVRVDNLTDMSLIMNLIKRWGLEYPNLLISVSGDTNEFQKRSKVRDGIMKAARDTGAWLITDGIVSSGMNQDITEPANILAEDVVIGIAPWGVIFNRHVLVNKKGFWPARYDTRRTCNSNERFLNPNHSHYILVDDGSQHKFDIEIPFRLKLEHEIAKTKTMSGNDVLIVSLVLGGGESTLRKVNQTLKHDIPVVVVKGTGGAADILAFAFENASTCDEYANSDHGQDSNRHDKFMPKTLEDVIEKKMTQNDIRCKITTIKSSLLKSDLIHIVDLESDDYIRAVLLKALTKAYVHKMKISNAKLIFSNNVDEIIFHDLQYGKGNIVKQLINTNRCTLAKFLRSKKLITLYNNVFFKRIFNEIQLKKKEEIKLIDVRHLIQNLVDRDLLHHYKEDKTEQENQNTPGFATANAPQENSDPLTMDPCLDLLIWSVLNNRQDIAKVFWRHGKVKMVNALVAHALFSALSRKINDRDLCEALDNNSSEFMTLAIKTAKACSKANEEKTYKLLKGRSLLWGNTTCIDIAVSSPNQGFISLKVCRDLFDKTWMGGLKPQNSLKRLLGCIVFPPLIICLARFEKKNDIQETLCCFPSKKRNGYKDDQVEENNMDDTSQTNRLKGPNGNSRKESKCMNACWKLRTFYCAPIIVFMHNMILFVAFLVLYSYVLLSKLEPYLSVENVCLIIWVLSFFIGEIIEFKRIRTFSVPNMWKFYRADGWNFLDMLAILLFISGMSALMINPQPIYVEIARDILGIDLVLFFLRLLHAFHAHRQLGPKLVMILNMLWDLVTLAAIFCVFVLAYAVASYAILYPNTALSINTPMKILKRPYWNIFGDLGMQEIEGEADCSDNETLYGNGSVPRCPTMSGQYVVPVIMGIYMMMTNILLLSLLIASFSYSIEKVQKHTDLHCSYHRYKLICEYYTKPWLAHPFAILSYLIQIMIFICGKLEIKYAFEETFENDVEHLCEFEHTHALKVYQRFEQTREENINVKRKPEDKRLWDIIKKMNQKLNEVLTQKSTQTTSNVNEPNSTGATNLDEKVQTLEKQLQTAMDTLKELKEHKPETKQSSQMKTKRRVKDTSTLP